MTESLQQKRGSGRGVRSIEKSVIGVTLKCPGKQQEEQLGLNRFDSDRLFESGTEGGEGSGKGRGE